MKTDMACISKSSTWRVDPVPTIGVVIYEVKVIAVVNSAEMSLSDGKANTVCETLTERTGGDLDTFGADYLSEYEIRCSGQIVLPSV